MKALKLQTHLGYVVVVTVTLFALALIALVFHSDRAFVAAFIFIAIVVAYPTFALWMLTAHRAAETRHAGGRHVMHH